MTRTRAAAQALIAAALCVPITAGMVALERLSPRFRLLERMDYVVYYKYARLICYGGVPYRDFLVEYPPLSLLMVAAPRAFVGSMDDYVPFFSARVLLVNALLLQVVAWWAGRGGAPGAVRRSLVWYVLCYTLLARLAVTKMDLLPTLFAFAATTAWAAGRAVPGGALCAAGVLTKFFPVVVAGPAGLAELRHWRTSGLKGLLSLAVCASVGAAGWMALGRSKVAESVAFQSDRGIEMGSTYAGVVMALNRARSEPMSTAIAHGSVELRGAGFDTAARLARPLTLLALAAGVLSCLLARDPCPVRQTAGLITGLIVTSPVFSPQYVLWLLPFVAALDRPRDRLARPTYGLACLLTFLVCPVLTWPLASFHWAGVLALNLRNLAMVALWSVLLWGGGRGGEPAPPAAPF